MPKLLFKIDPEREYEYHQIFIGHKGLESLSQFNLESIKDKDQVIEKINSFWTRENKKIISEIENQWKTIEELYFLLIEEITEVKWERDEYFVYCLAFSSSRGFSCPFIPRSQEISITTGAIINPKFIIAHELYHTHYYEIVNKLRLGPQTMNTLFNEGTAALVLFKTKAFELFPNTHPQTSIDCYPSVSNNWPILVNLWEKRTSFKGFLEEAYTELKDHI